MCPKYYNLRLVKKFESEKSTIKRTFELFKQYQKEV